MDKPLTEEEQKVWDILKTPPMTRREQIADDLKRALARANRVQNPEDAAKRMKVVYGLK